MAAVARSTYFVIFALLLVLLAVTVAVSFVSLGVWGPIAAMTIATVKGVLILLYFMHLRYEVPLVRVFASAGFLWLGILLAFLVSDYQTRNNATPAQASASDGP